MTSSPTNTTRDLHPRVRERLDAIWSQAYAANGKDDLVTLYQDWSDTYDSDHEAIGYVGHVAASEVLARNTPPDARVLDAGCGTGLVGAVLGDRGFHRLTALDLSPAMLDHAARKGVYEDLRLGDLDKPLDELGSDAFQAAILVGVFSYGQAPAHALEEILRVVEPGGHVVFTMRTDFHRDDAMGVATKIQQLVDRGAWALVERTEPRQYLPLKDPDVQFRVWCFEVLPGKREPAPDDFHAAVREAFSAPGPVKVLSHHFIWDGMASRLYDEYIQRPEYYLNSAEEEILQVNAGDFLGDRALCVELGCGSAEKIRHVFDAVLADDDGQRLEYMPIDLSPGALETAALQISEFFGDAVAVTPHLGHFDEALASIPADRVKAVFLLGGSIGNFETIDETVDLLRMVRERLTERDRFVVGFDLCKEPEIFRAAYNAGESNRLFFVNMLRRINLLLGADFDLNAFETDSTYREDPDEDGLHTGRVDLRVKTTLPQRVSIRELDLTVDLAEGDVVRVGVSRKFAPGAIAELAARAGLRVRSMWFDKDQAFALSEFVRDDAPAV